MYMSQKCGILHDTWKIFRDYIFLFRSRFDFNLDHLWSFHDSAKSGVELFSLVTVEWNFNFTWLKALRDRSGIRAVTGNFIINSNSFLTWSKRTFNFCGQTLPLPRMLLDGNCCAENRQSWFLLTCKFLDVEIYDMLTQLLLKVINASS